jgi:multiple sugar transport system substrate-binding protein
MTDTKHLSIMEEKMEKFRKALVVAVIASLVLSVTMCKKSEGVATAGGRTAQAVREIVFWDMAWGPADTYPVTMQGLVDRFNSENTENIHVTMQNVPWDNFYQVFLTAVTSNAAPDVATGAFMQPIQYAEMGEGLPLDPIVEQWKKENNPILDDYSEILFNLYKYDGKYYGLPWNLDTRQILYRTDYFKQAGITKLPTNWIEFLDVCAQLKKTLPQDVFPFVFPGGGDYNGLQALITFLVQNDVGLTDAQGKPDFTNQKVTEVLQFINALYVNGYVPSGLPAYKATDAEKLFQAGKAVMYMQGMMDLKDFPEIDANAAVLPPMAGPSGTPKYYTWVNGIGAFSQTKDPKACYAFIKWLLENELPLWPQGQLTSIPARISFRSDPYFTNAWQKKQVSELALPTIVTVVYPSSTIYLPFSVIEGEATPIISLVKACTQNPNYKAIQQEVQNIMLASWAEFDM